MGLPLKMKGMSIKLKITLWFSVFMVLLCGAVFAFVALLSGSETSRDKERELISFVTSNSGGVRMIDGKLKKDGDFTIYRNGMYCVVLSQDGEALDGSLPYDELSEMEIDGSGIRSVTVGGDGYLVYDFQLQGKGRESVWLRGVTLENSGGLSTAALIRAACIALPLLLVFAVAGGYLIASRSLRPIREISDTAEQIGASGDLTRRIAMKPGKDELHQLAEVFNTMFERLEKNFDAERSFTSDASHELRTPLTTILAQCEYAMENECTAEELYEALGVVEKQGFRMKRMIESLLQFTPVEQQTETSRGRKSTSARFRDDSASSRSLGSRASRFRRHRSRIYVGGDESLLGGCLELIRTPTIRPRTGASVGLHVEKGRAVLTVTDDGIGIAEDELPKIWNRFYRADKVRGPSGESGFGLGLAMVRQIAALHRGSVSAESAVGKGSRFTVELPIFT